jgi:hypothetical protein
MIGCLAFHPKTYDHVIWQITSNDFSWCSFGCSGRTCVGRYFKVYQTELARIPSDLRQRPIFFTELNPHNSSWSDTNNGYVQQAYAEIQDWNRYHTNDRNITAMMLYRWPNLDRWGIEDKTQVHADLRAAVLQGYQNNGSGGSIPTPTFTLTHTQTPTPVDTTTPTICLGDSNRDLFVNVLDYRTVRDYFGQAGCGVGDANGDCFVNSADYRAVRDYFGQPCN